MLVAAAIAGIRGMKTRDIRVGALFWPEKFAEENDWQLSIMGGWGIASHSPADGTIFLHDEEIHDDGGFCGHTWIEDPDTGRIIDLIHGVDGGPALISRSFKTIALWKRRVKQERLVKNYWRLEMRAAMKAGHALRKQRQLEEIAERLKAAARKLEEA